MDIPTFGSGMATWHPKTTSEVTESSCSEKTEVVH